MSSSETQQFSNRGGEVLERALHRARWSILWERLWPPVLALATLAGLFLGLSWLGLWLLLPAAGRIAGLLLFAAAAGAAAFPLIFVRFPTHHDALRRLDRGSGLAHRPATAIVDKIAAGPNDPMSVALWRTHVNRVIALARHLKSGWPAPRVDLRDPYALRALVLVLAVATFFYAGGDRGRRIATAFDWSGVVPTLNYRVDAWVTPPAYTARPPLILPGLRPGEAARAQPVAAVPVGSVLVIRGTGTRDLDVAVKGGLREEKNEGLTKVPSGTHERRYVIDDRGEAALRGYGGEGIAWSFTAIPDRAPKIELAKDPEPQGRGALQFVYTVEDDYGVVEAQAIFTLRKNDSVDGKTVRPLFGSPDFNLSLPQQRTRNGVGQIVKDLSDHPWAGVDVVLTLVAHDEAGQEGRSSPFEMRLPERTFVKPLARALIEQRRNLALDAEAAPRVLAALDALSIAPERFTPEASIYLGLRAIYWQLTRAKTDDALRDVVARLWSMAVTIEDGNVSDAEAALRAAQEALRQALERGASEEEIKRLTDELRAALDKFLQALAEELRKNPQKLARPLDQNTRNIRPQDLKNMIDRLETLARSGAKDAARRLLDELRSILENLQTARPGGMPGEDDDDMMSALDELGNMIRRQQQLRDRTFRQGQDMRRERQRGQQGQRGQDGQQGQNFGELRQDQQALRDQLNKLLEELRKRGLGQDQGGGEQGQNEMKSLGRAGEAMGDAEGSLGEGNAEGAVDAQGRALEALRKGAQGLAQSMQQPGMGPGPGQPGRTGPARAQQETDPLGRPLRGRDYGDDVTVKVPGEIDVQRARRILEELRRRFGDTMRPQLELDYIERLLRDF
ncbi:MAG: TIGR02302 family protein [Rhizobiales bacterium]|nr:TIGR02302 family protein [Hyphomicrobiales bacterium]